MSDNTSSSEAESARINHKGQIYFTRYRLACLGVLLLSGLAYLQSLSGLAIWDDKSLIGGKGIGGGDSLLHCFTHPFLQHYFRPLVSVSFYVDRKLFGTGPFFYHQTNILIHVFTTGVLIAMLAAAFGNRRLAVLGGALFAVQPVQVSTVAWVGGRTDSLATLFIALFAWMLIRSAQSRAGARVAWLTGAVVAYGAALLAKEQFLLALPLVPLTYQCFAQPAERPGRAWLARASCAFVTVAIGFIALWAAFWPTPFTPVVHSLREQLMLGGESISYYTLLFLAPAPRWMHMLSVAAFDSAAPLAAVFGYIVLFAALWAVWRWRRTAPAASWFLALVLLVMLPVSNLIPVPSLVVAPYRAGVAGLGMAALMAWAFVTFIERAELRSFRPLLSFAGGKPAGTLAALAFCSWCFALTLWGVAQWQSERTVFSTFVRYDPTSIIARYNLATALVQTGQSRQASHEIETMLTQLFRSQDWRSGVAANRDLKADRSILNRVRENQGNTVKPTEWLAALYGQLGFARLTSHDRAGGRLAFQVGLAIDRRSEDVNIGLSLLALQDGKARDACDYARVAEAGGSQIGEVHMVLGQAFAARGWWSQAREEYQTWARLQPWVGQAFMELAKANQELGDYARARSVLEYAQTHTICNKRDVQDRLDALPPFGAQSL